MNALKIIQATMIVILTTSPRVPQQPAAPAPPAQAPAGQEKTTSPQDTQKRLEALACGPAEVHHIIKTEKTPPPLPEPSGQGSDLRSTPNALRRKYAI